MAERSGYSGGQLFMAALGGAAVGAAVAYFTAPRTGAKSRAKFIETLEDGRETVIDGVNSGREMLRDGIVEGREMVKNGKEKARAIPGAVKGAGVAARDAFVDTLREEMSA